jgi:aerobic-type carbon monoxide dehydrogenase small subunit (CoxS/CutS family)
MIATMTISMTVNGETVDCIVRPRQLLADVLRDDLRLTGTHVACGTGHCGSCTILLDGQPIRSCLTLAVQADGATIETVESVGVDGQLHPIQTAFQTHHGLQCGFCTPGFIMSTVALLRRSPQPKTAEIDEMLAGHLCRCTGYRNIARAVESLANTPENADGR